jgi:hypothetical protein
MCHASPVLMTDTRSSVTSGSAISAITTLSYAAAGSRGARHAWTREAGGDTQQWQQGCELVMVTTAHKHAAAKCRAGGWKGRCGAEVYTWAFLQSCTAQPFMRAAYYCPRGRVIDSHPACPAHCWPGALSSLITCGCMPAGTARAGSDCRTGPQAKSYSSTSDSVHIVHRPAYG